MNKPGLDAQLFTIYKKIRERICLLQYPPGEMLSENALATEFEISRTPMRRILRLLEFEGLVVSRQGVGTLVTTANLKSVKEVYQLRIKLAEVIGEISPIPSADGDIDILDRLLERCEMMRDHPNHEELGRINMAFNDALVLFINNLALRDISDRLYYQTARVWPQILPDMDWNEEVEYMCTEISQVADALRENDMERVGLVRRDHISMSLSRIQRYLGPGNTSPQRLG
ncbi:MAG: GntR family transcriptional regulator [Anaerolineae bacterium]|nr:GntR family transcriptional regulator [Anaerolineae bacterium]